MTEPYVTPNYTFINQNFFTKDLLEKVEDLLSFDRRIYNPSSNSYDIKTITLLRKTKPTGKLSQVFQNTSEIYYFPTGFIPIIEKELSIQLFNPKQLLNKFLDLDKLNNLQDTKILKNLRNYQLEAVKSLIQNIRGIVQIPTGGGKTWIIASIIELAKPTTNILVIVPKSSTLLLQHLNFLLQFFPKEEIGYYYSEGKKPGRITLTTINSLKLIPHINQIDMILIDECQATPSTTILEIMQLAKNSWIRYGFSATPLGRSDERDYYTHAILGDILYKVDYRTLQEQNFLSEMYYYSIHFSTPYILYKNQKIPVDTDLFYLNKYNEVCKLFIENNPYRLEIITKLTNYILTKYPERNCMIICDRKKLASNIYQELSSLFPNQVKLLTGDTSHNAREKSLTQFKNNQIRILITTQLIEYGIDIPNLNTIILASIGKSPIQLIQRIGRGMRYSSEPLIVFDLIEENNKVLLNQYRQRAKILSKEGFTIKQIGVDKLFEKIYNQKQK
ncbi:MAG: DEAD/DEAH box helicase [Nitrososphaeria archaeon]